MGYKDKILAKEGAPNADTTNGLTGDLEGVGPYQFIKKWHSAAVKKRLGLEWEDFKKSKEAQEKYFELYDKETLTPAIGKYKVKLQKTFPNISDDQVKQMIHFGGNGNVEKALKDPSYFYKGIDKNGTSLASYSDLGEAVKQKEEASKSFVPADYAFKPPMVPSTGVLQPVDKQWWGDTPIGQFTRTGRYTPPSKEDSNYPAIKAEPRSATAQVEPRRQKSGSDLMSFASNIANAFTKAPAPPAPIYGRPIALQRINMNNDRNEVERGVRSMDRFSEQQLDPQAAAQMKAYSNAQRFSQLSKVNQEERNTNLGIANDEMKMNLGVSMQNLGVKRDYNNSLFERKAAQQRFNQENLANAADKFTGIQDRKAMERSVMYSEDLKAAGDDYGTWKRLQAKLEAEGKAPQRYGGKLKNGGIISNYGAGTMFRMNFKRIK
jgi:hypothetical protein